MWVNVTPFGREVHVKALGVEPRSVEVPHAAFLDVEPSRPLAPGGAVVIRSLGAGLLGQGGVDLPQGGERPGGDLFGVAGGQA